MTVPTILTKILNRKHEELKERKKQLSLSMLQGSITDLTNVRDFQGAIDRRVERGDAAVIAELKKASPSKGVIRENFNPGAIAKSYEKFGAACLSVLTDKDFFQGSEQYLRDAHSNCSLPILRKDFMIDEWQIYESRYIGADCILLIVAALTNDQMVKLYEIARTIDLSVLVEVHDEEELERALLLKNALLGINNRNLHTFEVSLETTYKLLPSVPNGRMVVTESGIHTPNDVKIMMEKKVQSFLVGEAFMRKKDPGEGIQELFGNYLTT